MSDYVRGVMDIVNEDRTLAVSSQSAKGGATVRGQMKSDDQTRKLTEEELEALIDNPWETGDSEQQVPDSTNRAKRVAVSATGARRVRGSTTGVRSTTKQPPSKELEKNNVRAAPKRKAKQVPDSTTGPKRMAGSTGARRLPDSTTGVRNTTEHRLSKGGAAVRGQMKRNEQTRKLTVEKLEAPIDNSWEIGDSEHEVPDSTTCSKRVVVTTTSAVHVPDSTTGVKSTTEHRLSQALICDSDSTDGSDIVVTVNNSTKPRDEIFGETGSMYNPSECAAPIMSDSVAPRDAARVSSSKFYRTSSAYPGTMEIPPQCRNNAVSSTLTSLYRGTESVLADRVPKHGGQEEDGVGLRHPHHQMKAHDGSLPQSGGDYAEREKIDDKTPQETSTKHVLNAKKHTME